MEKKTTFYPEGGLAKRAVWGGVMSIIEQIILAVQNIIFVPLLLWAWGDVLYGEWMIIFSLAAYLSWIDIGSKNYVVNSMTRAYAKGDTEEYNNIFKSAFWFYGKISLIIILLTVLLVWFLPLVEWFKIQAIAPIWFIVALLIMAFHTIFSVTLGFVSSLHSTLGEYPRGRAISNISGIILVLAVAGAVVMGGQLVMIASIYLVIFLLTIGYRFWDVSIRHRELKLIKGGFNKKTEIEFILPGLVFLLIVVAEIIKSQGAVTMVGVGFGAAAVTIFATHRILANLIFRLTSFIFPVLTPELAAEEVRGNYEKMRFLHSMSLKFILTITTAVAIWLNFSGRDIIEIWTLGKVEFIPELWMVFMIATPITSFWYFSSLFQVAINKYNFYAGVRLVAVIIGLGLAWWWEARWGITGIWAGFVAGEIAINMWAIPYRTLIIIKASKIKFLFEMMKIIPLLIIQLILAWWLYDIINLKWINYVVMATVVGIVSLIYLYKLWFTEQEKKMAESIVMRSLKKIKYF